MQTLRSRVTRPRARLTSLLAVFVLGGAGTASAKDFCIDIPNEGGNPELIAMSFAIPKPGKCRSFVGMYWPNAQYRRSAAPGAACTTSDGSVVNLTFTVGFSPSLPSANEDIGAVAFYTVKLALPSLQGRLSEIIHSTHPATSTRFDAVGYACKAKLFI